MAFAGFSEDDLKRIKSHQNKTTNDVTGDQNEKMSIKKINKLGERPQRLVNTYKSPVLQKHYSDDAIDGIDFAKCKLSIRDPACPIDTEESEMKDQFENSDEISSNTNQVPIENTDIVNYSENSVECIVERKFSTDFAPDIVRGMSNYTEDELSVHWKKLEDLQMKQRIMEEQNKMKKEMLSKALADRTKQTKEEVLRLEKIKKELQVLDGQFSRDVAVLRRKIDQACTSYSEAEKVYLRTEKEFLQAKIRLQKEKEQKELLTEHLCTLITHNETRKAQKLETLMLELSTDKTDVPNPIDNDEPIIIDGVDQKTGKIFELPPES